MDKDPGISSEGGCFSSCLQYLCIALAVLLPAVWKLYTSHATFRFYCKYTVYAWFVFMASFLIIPMALRDPYNPDNARTCAGWIFNDLFKVYRVFGITIIKRGLQNFENMKGSFIVVCNHQTSLDLIPMFGILPKRCTALGKRELLYAGPFGFAASLCGGIFVDRRPGKARDKLDQTVQNLRTENIRLWIFPEGTRNHEGGLMPFKKGAFHMAIQAKIPIVPVVNSSYTSFYEKKTAKFEEGKIITTVLPPVSSEGYTAENINEFIEKVRSQMVTVFESSSKEVSTL